MKTFRAPTSFSILALLLALVAGTHAETPGTSKSPNVLFIIADDLATRLGCYGDKSAITPHLDRLAAEGVVFNRAYCQGAVCTASRTSFMLGLNSRHAKASHFLTHPETMTLGRWFRERGYQTCSIGKIDHDDPTDSYVDPKAWDIRVKREDLAPKLPIQRRFFDEDLEEVGTLATIQHVLTTPDTWAHFTNFVPALVYMGSAMSAYVIHAAQLANAQAGQGTWQTICSQMETQFGQSHYEAGALQGIAAVAQCLRSHFPHDAMRDNELPNAPVLLD